ncbi:MAG: STAS domain-containing protein [Anaerolineales bacterium]|nr:STAS domain-containing protein [Anaerolineales bacterium]MBX3036381.1 STAS domain-containing protein [Anaerolineales bacterium]
MADKLKITKTDGEVPVLHVAGHLDGETENLLVSEATSLFNEGKKNLILELSKVDMISSAGLRAIHVIYKMFTQHPDMEKWQSEHAGETFKSPFLKLAQPSSQVHYVLSMAGFLQNIYIYPTLQEALESF